jgi:hypothetical protein
MKPIFTLRYNTVLSIFILNFALLGVFNLEAATITATSISDLQNKINSAVSGDIINLANGHYTNNVISIAKTNITIQATTPGGVFLDGTNAITISGNNNTFSGFQFVSGTTAGGKVVTVTGSYNTITQLNFNGYSASKMVQLEGSYNTVSYCNFQNKPTDVSTASKGGDGDMLQIIPNATKPGNNLIRYCSFQHMPGKGGDWGNECIRIGDGNYSLMISRTIVEYCYFEDTGMGDSEAVSVKSRQNILRYNTMNNNPDAMFAFRRGDYNVAYGNFFINSGGIRPKEANNIFCYNNYFEKSGVAGSMNAVTYIYYTANTTHVLDSVNFLHNTFVECGDIDFGGVGATNGVWANNLFVKSTGNIFTNPNIGTSFTGNIYQGTLGISIPSGMTSADPKLALNSDGYYGLTASSPAIGAASAAYPAMLNLPGIDTLHLDIRGLARPVSRLLKDVGCEQFSATGTATNRPLKLADVGPSYLSQLSAIVPVSANHSQFTVFHDATSGNMNISYELKSPSKVSINMYSLQGLLVKQLIQSEVQQSGIYKSNFKISDLRNGVYLVQLNSDSGNETIKLIIWN